MLRSSIQSILLVFVLFLSVSSCETNSQDAGDPDNAYNLSDFPDFITPAEDYFDLSLGKKPVLDPKQYRLTVSGAVNEPASYSLEDLRKLEMVEQTVTVECIHNGPNGNLLGTATWKGFLLYDLLENLGIQEGVSFVKYTSADGYFTYNTLEELQHGNVLGAIYMNGDSIPVKYGYPLRIIFPGYYGVRHPGWVTKIELLGSGVKDYWGETQFLRWRTDSAMAIDSKIFFPANQDTVTLGEKFWIGGAAYGSGRVARVEITPDGGITWLEADIVKETDQDHAWVFWEANYIPQSAGRLTIRCRATALSGRVQPRNDAEPLDGNNAWPRVSVIVDNLLATTRQ
jgi:DMSO/TMAO reductase YedYZ molybdopterin-dependent catalytic subunit